MAEDISARQLHDRATRGETLSDAERVRLQFWYEQQDAEEYTLLNSPASSTPTSLEALRGEVEAALTQVSRVTRHIQALAEENEALRRDVAALHQRLAHTPFPQAV